MIICVIFIQNIIKYDQKHFFSMSSQNLHKIIQLIVTRHGQSQYNLARKWSGWTDVKLTPKGVEEARLCGKILKKRGFIFDQAYCSALTRSIKSLNEILYELDQCYIPVNKSWRLNEKHYGILQGQVKAEMKQKYGLQIINQWRRGYSTRPPGLPLQHWHHPRNDPRYKHLPLQLLPAAESLQDVITRVKFLWQTQLQTKIRAGKNILMVVHGSTIRALLRIIFNQEIQIVKKFNFPNGTPLVLKLTNQMQPISYQLLGDQEEIQAKMQQIKQEIN